MMDSILKVLCFSSIEFSGKTFEDALSAGLEVEWGTAITEEEVTILEPFYDFIIMGEGKKFHSKKCIRFEKLITTNKPENVKML